MMFAGFLTPTLFISSVIFCSVTRRTARRVSVSLIQSLRPGGVWPRRAGTPTLTMTTPGWWPAPPCSWWSPEWQPWVSIHCMSCSEIFMIQQSTKLHTPGYTCAEFLWSSLSLGENYLLYSAFILHFSYFITTNQNQLMSLIKCGSRRFPRLGYLHWTLETQLRPVSWALISFVCGEDDMSEVGTKSQWVRC